MMILLTGYLTAILHPLTCEEYIVKSYVRIKQAGGHQPLLDFATLVSEGDGHSADTVSVESHIMLMEIRGHPADPHIKWLLAWKNPH